MADNEFHVAGHTFYLYKLSDRFTTTFGAVYVYINASMTPGKIVYVGQTNDINRRLDEHTTDDKAACLRRNGATHYAVRVEDSEAGRKTLESMILLSDSPICNKQ